jgi:hypothetical protein
MYPNNKIRILTQHILLPRLRGWHIQIRNSCNKRIQSRKKQNPQSEDYVCALCEHTINYQKKYNCMALHLFGFGFRRSVTTRDLGKVAVRISKQVCRRAELQQTTEPEH